MIIPLNNAEYYENKGTIFRIKKVNVCHILRIYKKKSDESRSATLLPSLKPDIRPSKSKLDDTCLNLSFQV